MLVRLMLLLYLLLFTLHLAIMTVTMSTEIPYPFIAQWFGTLINETGISLAALEDDVAEEVQLQTLSQSCLFLYLFIYFHVHSCFRSPILQISLQAAPAADVIVRIDNRLRKGGSRSDQVLDRFSFCCSVA
jgi:hypothetical protein